MLLPRSAGRLRPSRLVADSARRGRCTRQAGRCQEAADQARGEDSAVGSRGHGEFGHGSRDGGGKCKLPPRHKVRGHANSALELLLSEVVRGVTVARENGTRALSRLGRGCDDTRLDPWRLT